MGKLYWFSYRLGRAASGAEMEWVLAGLQGSRGAMSERKTTILFKRGSSRSSEDEWLGPESHMPNLNRALRRRDPRDMGLSSGWVVGAMFAAGVAAGCLVMSLLDRRSRTS
jgi:hypothetical protein